MAIVREKVYPQRMEQRRAVRKRYWWRYGEAAPALYRAIAPLRRVLVLTLVSRTVAFAFVSPHWVYAHRLAVFAFEDSGYLALLQSSFHYHWAWQYSSTLKQDLNYAPTDVFQTFPFPHNFTALDPIGERYHEHRRQIMLDRQEGLTATYNRFHDPAESAADIAELRRLHVAMDHAVAAAYGWNDLDLGHGFHETRQGVRYTISEPARREVLTRLLALNHARYAEEVAAGLHDKKSAKGKGKQRRERSEDGAAPSDGDEPPEQQELFDDGSPKQRRLL